MIDSAKDYYTLADDLGPYQPHRHCEVFDHINVLSIKSRL